MCWTKTQAKWYFNGQSNLPQNAKILDRKYLALYMVTKENTGTYKCAGTTEYDIEFEAQMELLIIGWYLG